MQKIDYIGFLSNFDRFADIPRSSKKTGIYREYIYALKEYLIGFLERTRPLLDIKEEFEKVDAEFDKKWEEGCWHTSVALSNYNYLISLIAENAF